jgi:lysophospholipase L1-like esterase
MQSFVVSNSLAKPLGGTLGMGRNELPPVQYLLRDQFSADLAAGAIDGTAAETGTRTVRDVETIQTISGGKYNFATPATPNWGDDSLRYGAQTRTPGCTLTAQLTTSALTKYGPYFGFFTGAVPGLAGIENAIYADQNLIPAGFHVTTGISKSPILGNIIPATSYYLAVTTRAVGAYYFVKGGEYVSPTLLGKSEVGATASLYPASMTYDAACSHEFMQMIDTPRWLPVPLLSDGFSGTTSDGLGHAEGIAGDIGAGGAGLAWTDAVGTWGVAGGVCAASALADGKAIRTVDLGKADVYFSVALTRAAGTQEIALRYVDPSNYIYLRLFNDGSNKVTLRKVLAGVDSEVMAPFAVTYGDGKILTLIARGTEIRGMYDDNSFAAPRRWTVADAALQTGTKVGLITTDLGNTFDNATAYALGTGGEYSALDAFFVEKSTMGIFAVGDSKTEATADNFVGYPVYLAAQLTTSAVDCYERPLRYGIGGYKVAQMLAYATTHLPNETQTPHYITINLGINDTAGALPINGDQWKADYGALLDLLHAKWPDAKIGLMRVGKRTVDANVITAITSMDDVWIPQLIAARPYCFLGPDERVFLEAGDDYASLTVEGVHPNHAGHVETANQWYAAIASTANGQL